MPAESTYAYKARDGNGEVVTGTIVATSADEVSARLRTEGKFVVAIEHNPLRMATHLDDDQIRRNEAAKRVTKDDVIAFSQQVSVIFTNCHL